jgi:hypothetical protein
LTNDRPNPASSPRERSALDSVRYISSSLGISGGNGFGRNAVNALPP